MLTLTPAAAPAAGEPLTRSRLSISRVGVCSAWADCERGMPDEAASAERLLLLDGVDGDGEGAGEGGGEEVEDDDDDVAPWPSSSRAAAGDDESEGEKGMDMGESGAKESEG